MTTTTLRFEKKPTLKQQKMILDVLMAMGIPAHIEKHTYRESAQWIPSNEDLERIDKAKQSAAEGEVFFLSKEKQREFLGL